MTGSHSIDIVLKPNKAGLFEGSFFLGGTECFV